MKLIIPYNPIAKKRPRFARVGKGYKVYSLQVEQENAFKWEIKSQYRGKPLECAVAVSIIFYMYIPKSITKGKRLLMQQNVIHHTKKPDIDNLVKFVLDCMNGIIFKDDTQVVILTAKKWYGDNPRTEIVVDELKNKFE